MTPRQTEEKLTQEFAKAGMKKLDLRSSKGRLGWRKKTMKELWYGLLDEVDELQKAIWAGKGDIKGECVDVKNSVMFIWDKENGKI